MAGIDIGVRSDGAFKSPFLLTSSGAGNGRRGFKEIIYVQSWGAKSFVDDLDTGQSVVFSRAATILRSIETKLLIGRFVPPIFKRQMGLTLFGLSKNFEKKFGVVQNFFFVFALRRSGRSTRVRARRCLVFARACGVVKMRVWGGPAFFFSRPI